MSLDCSHSAMSIMAVRWMSINDACGNTVCRLHDACKSHCALCSHSQREDVQRQSEGKPHLRLCTAGYSHEAYAECVQLVPPSPLPLEAVLQLKMCSTFAVSEGYRYCQPIQGTIFKLQAQALW